MEVGNNVKWDGLIAVIVFITVIGTPHGDPLLDGFVGLKREEDRLIKNHQNLYVIVHYYGVSKLKT